MQFFTLFTAAAAVFATRKAELVARVLVEETGPAPALAHTLWLPFQRQARRLLLRDSAFDDPRNSDSKRFQRLDDKVYM